MQWNGEFRDDVRGFLRGEPGMVPSMVQRLAGSADLFTSPMCSLNFLTAHDGFTMYDLVAYDHRHNEANGWDNTDGRHHNRSWNCGSGGRCRSARRRDGPAPPAAAQRGVPAVAQPWRADVRGRRRVRPHAGRQQQRLQPGQRDVVDRLAAGDRVVGPRTVRPRRDRRSGCTSGAVGSGAVGEQVGRLRSDRRTRRQLRARGRSPGQSMGST